MTDLEARSPVSPPPQRCLMGPGPSNIDPRVIAAMGYPTLGHLDPEFCRMMEYTQAQLRRVFRTQGAFTVPLSAPASAAMEACIVNLVEPGQRLVVCQNGVFGGRMAEIGRRCGAQVDLLEFAWGREVDPDRLRGHLRDAVAEDRVAAVAWVHAETSTGVRSEVAELAAVAREFGALSIVDGVTALGGIDVRVDDWQVDAYYAGSQKCLSAPPGLAPLTISQSAIDSMRARSSPVPSWFLDFSLLGGYWQGQAGARTYHHTAPVHAIYALHAALNLLEEEGLEHAFARHHRAHRALAAGLDALDLELAVDPEILLPQLNVVRIPDGVDDGAVRAHMLNDFGVEIGGGLGEFAGKVWRIGTMGHSARIGPIVRCLHALASALGRPGVSAAEAARARFTSGAHD